MVFLNTMLVAKVTKTAPDQPAHTFRPMSSAKGSIYKSPTAETVAFPSSRDFATFEEQSWLAKA